MASGVGADIFHTLQKPLLENLPYSLPDKTDDSGAVLLDFGEESWYGVRHFLQREFCLLQELSLDIDESTARKLCNHYLDGWSLNQISLEKLVGYI